MANGQPKQATELPWSFEVCKDCGGKNIAAFRVTDSMWQRVTGQEEGVLCIACFDKRAADKGIDWTEEPIEFHPVSTVANQKWGKQEVYLPEPRQPKQSRSHITDEQRNQVTYDASLGRPKQAEYRVGTSFQIETMWVWPVYKGQFAAAIPTAYAPSAADADRIVAALNAVGPLAEALRRIADRAERIRAGEIETGAIGAADYDLQVAREALSQLREGEVRG